MVTLCVVSSVHNYMHIHVHVSINMHIYCTCMYMYMCLHHISLLRQVMATQVRFVLSVCGIVVCVGSGWST